jgi:guanylate kinase
MKKRIILVGKAAAGKDYLRKILIERGFKPAVSFTTRPPRPGEAGGQDYNFISLDLANEYIKQGKFLEYVVFNEWIYGTTLEQWNS